MQENRRNQLDAKLKEMIKDFEQAEAKQKEPIRQSGAGNGIRRREGEKDKRFFCLRKDGQLREDLPFLESDYT